MPIRTKYWWDSIDDLTWAILFVAKGSSLSSSWAMNFFNGAKNKYWLTENKLHFRRWWMLRTIGFAWTELNINAAVLRSTDCFLWHLLLLFNWIFIIMIPQFTSYSANRSPLTALIRSWNWIQLNRIWHLHCNADMIVIKHPFNCLFHLHFPCLAFRKQLIKINVENASLIELKLVQFVTWNCAFFTNNECCFLRWNFSIAAIVVDCGIGNWTSHWEKKVEILIKSNVDFGLTFTFLFRSWFNGHHAPFFPQLNELVHQIEFHIILKQFQNKFNRSQRTDNRKKMGNVLLLLAEYAFGQKQANCVNWKTNENEEAHTKKILLYRDESKKTSCEWRENGYGINGLSDMERWGSNNVNILFHRFSCRQTQC